MTRVHSQAMLLGFLISIWGLAGDKVVDLAAWRSTPAVHGLATCVPELAYPLPEGWLPTLFWWQVPLSYDNAAALEGELRVLAARGLSPCIELRGDYQAPAEHIENAIDSARALAAAGIPVNLAMKGGLSLYRLPDGTLARHADAPDDEQKDAHGKIFSWLPLRDGWTAMAMHLEQLFARFAAATIPIAGVWYDYEDHPHPWNGMWQHSGRCARCRQAIGDENLKDRESWLTWVYNLNVEALATAFAGPVEAALPAAEVGFYGYVPSTEEYPTMPWLGTSYAYPPRRINPSSIDVAQPVCYASRGIAAKAGNHDAAYLATLLNAIRHVQRNLRIDQRLMPYVCSEVTPHHFAQAPRLSKAMYREFLRHTILRGARGFYCFNVAPPYMPTPEHYSELADINSVYNELFAPPFREFLEGGVVLNDSYLDPAEESAIVWSGMRRGNRALIRVLSLGAPTIVEIAPFPDLTVHLIAPSGGKSYLVDESGSIEPLN